MAADRIGASNAILGAALLLIVLVGLFYAMSPTLRRLDDSINETMSAGHGATAARKAA
jgi:hypothetical protein